MNITCPPWQRRGNFFRGFFLVGLQYSQSRTCSLVLKTKLKKSQPSRRIVRLCCSEHSSPTEALLHDMMSARTHNNSTNYENKNNNNRYVPFGKRRQRRIRRQKTSHLKHLNEHVQGVRHGGVTTKPTFSKIL